MLTNPCANFTFSNVAVKSIQANLKISRPSDIYEREADRVAEQINLMSAESASPLAGVDEKTNHKCRNCEDEEKISRKTSAGAGSMQKETLQQKCAYGTSPSMVRE